MNKPLVSIITVCYNSASTIEDTILSVKEQSYKNIQYIIIDGESTDSSADIIKRHSAAVTHFLSQKDTGIYQAMNRGLALAKGEYTLYLNADDVLVNNTIIEKLITSAKEHGTSAICAGVNIYKGQKLKRTYSSTHFKKWMFRFGHQPPHPGFLCQTTLLKSAGGFNESYKIAGDFDLLLKCFIQDTFTWKAIPLTSVNMQSGGASDGGLKQKKLMNAEILESLKSNRVYSNFIMVWSKYLLKIFQFR